MNIQESPPPSKGSLNFTNTDSLSDSDDTNDRDWDGPMMTRDDLRRYVSRLRYDSTTGQIQSFPPLRCARDLQEWQVAMEGELAQSQINRTQWSDAAILFLEDEVNIEMRKRRNRRGGEAWLWEEFQCELCDVLNELDSRLSTLEQFRQDHPAVYSVAKVAGPRLAIAGASVLVPAVGIGILNAVGFTSSGIAAGSIATGIQARFYGGATTGLFSLCQSIGATAVPASSIAVVSAVGSVAVEVVAEELEKAGNEACGSMGFRERGGLIAVGIATSIFKGVGII